MNSRSRHSIPAGRKSIYDDSGRDSPKSVPTDFAGKLRLVHVRLLRVAIRDSALLTASAITNKEHDTEIDQTAKLPLDLRSRPQILY